MRSILGARPHRGPPGRQAWAEAEDIAAAYDLDDLAGHNRRGPLTVRWIYLHLVEELARHAGHGDILREQILAADVTGPTGRPPEAS
jgi:hypothetical protein